MMICTRGNNCACSLQALNDTKAHLAKLEAEGEALRRDIAARGAECAGFERDFAQTQVQADTVEKTYRQLQAEHNNV